MPSPTNGPAADFALLSRRVITPEGERAGAVLVRDERIVAVVDAGAIPPGMPIEDVGDAVLLPGLVDSHVHVNEPGRTDWEGFDSATRAAAAGGVTTVVDMPLNSSPVTTTRDALLRKRDAAAGQGRVDCGFWGGLVPGNLAELGRPARRRRLRREGLPLPLGHRRFPGRRGGRAPRGAADPRRARQAAAGPRRAGDGRHAAAGGSAPLRDVPRLAAAVLGARSRGAAASPLPGARGRPCTSCTCRPPPPCRSWPKRAARACRSRPRPARTTWRSPPRRWRTATRSSSARRRCASARIATRSGRRSSTGRSTSSSRITRRVRRS